VSHTHGADSEVGRLRTVLAHRPGAELLRITPRTRDQLLVSRVPWAGRVQQEHDILAQTLRDHGVEVLYVMELLQDVMEYPSARDEAIASALRDPRLGEQLRADLGSHLGGLDPEELAQVLVAGLAPEEFRTGRGVAFGLLDRHDFVIPPLPNLAFQRDSSVWIGPAVAVTCPADPLPAPSAVRRYHLRLRPGAGAPGRRRCAPAGTRSGRRRAD
jgi:arginine deiminase